MTHEYATAARSPLDSERLQAPFPIDVLGVVGSTQLEVKARLEGGARPPFAVVAEEQMQGRGRLQRGWQAPLHSSVLMSVALTGHDEAFTLRVGVVVARALAEHGVEAALKWPNDIVIERDGRLRKLGGIIAEVHQDVTVVVGIGLNIDMTDVELPTPEAISCRQLGPVPRRESVINHILASLADGISGIDLDAYRALCATIGAEVEVTPIAGARMSGQVIGIDDSGALVLRSSDEVVHVMSGDVQHLRSATP